MYYNLEKAAEILGLQTGEVNRLREQGKLRAFRDGATWKFRKEDVDKFLATMIKERSGAQGAVDQAADAASDLLNSDYAEDKTLAGDSASFDAMFDQLGDSMIIPQSGDVEFVADSDANEKTDEFVLADDAPAAAADDDLQLAPAADDDLQLASDPDDDLALAASDDSVLTSEDSALVEDPVDALIAEPGGTSNVDLAGSGSSDNVLSSDSGSGLTLGSGSDSGLSLMEGSGVDLTADGDIVLGGSGSGSSGNNLSTGSDSGLSLLGDSDGAFELVSDEGSASAEEGGTYGLATDNILNMGGGDADAATQLAEESNFELADGASSGFASDSESGSQALFTTESDESEAQDPFFTTDDSQESGGDLAGDTTETPFFGDNSGEMSSSIEVMDDNSSLAPSVSEELSAAFPSGESFPSSLGGDNSFEASSFNSPIGGDDLSGASGFGGLDEAPVPQPTARRAEAKAFTGGTIALLVVCMVALLLATIGAVELCRTIWSYQEGSVEIGGPLLEMIAKTIHLM